MVSEGSERSIAADAAYSPRERGVLIAVLDELPRALASARTSAFPSAIDAFVVESVALRGKPGSAEVEFVVRNPQTDVRVGYRYPMAPPPDLDVVANWPAPQWAGLMLINFEEEVATRPLPEPDASGIRWVGDEPSRLDDA